MAEAEEEKENDFVAPTPTTTTTIMTTTMTTTTPHPPFDAGDHVVLPCNAAGGVDPVRASRHSRVRRAGDMRRVDSVRFRFHHRRGGGWWR